MSKPKNPLSPTLNEVDAEEQEPPSETIAPRTTHSRPIDRRRACRRSSCAIAPIISSAPQTRPARVPSVTSRSRVVPCCGRREVLESVPGADRHPAQRRRQGQPVLPARLQPRPRHRLRDVLRRHAGEPADARHGQGYTDLNFLIPELVDRIDYRKGPYYADDGDFSSAGAADSSYFDVLPQGIASSSGGQYRLRRGCSSADSPAVGGRAICSTPSKVNYNDGPWDEPRRLPARSTALLRFSCGDDGDGSSVTAIGYHGDWNSTDQVAAARDRRRHHRPLRRDRSTATAATRRATALAANGIATPSAGPVRASSPTATTTTSPVLELHLLPRRPGARRPVRAERPPLGRSASSADHTLDCDALRARRCDNTVGLQVRSDLIRQRPLSTPRARPRSATTRRTTSSRRASALYVENETQWTDWFRTDAGLRVDVYRLRRRRRPAANSGTQGRGDREPEARAWSSGPGRRRSSISNGGFGFHSNDARGATTRVDPGRPAMPSTPADPLVRTEGRRGRRAHRGRAGPAELASRSGPRPRLRAALRRRRRHHRGQPPEPPLRRRVRELLQPAPLAHARRATSPVAHARFRGNDPAGDYIPGSIETVDRAGITRATTSTDFFGSVRAALLRSARR